MTSSHHSARDAVKARMVIATEHAIFRDGLRHLLRHERGVNVLGEAADGARALQQARDLQPDILLLDMALPGLPTAVVLRGLAGSRSNTRPLVLSGGIDDRTMLTLFNLGARGVVLNDSGGVVLLRAIATIMTDRYWLDRDSVSDLVHAVNRQSTHRGRDAHFGLTARELDIIAAVAAASCNKEIALRFSIAEKTVKHHLTNIFDKTGVSNRLELALFALHHGLHVLAAAD